MNCRKVKRIANKTIKYIKYLQDKGVSVLQDKEGNITFIGRENAEALHLYLNRPVKCVINGKNALIYENKTYLLDKGE